MKLIHLAAAAAFVLSMTGVTASAQQTPSWRGGYDDLPNGGYQRTCRDISAFNGRLYARCQTRTGNLTYSELDLRGCRGRVENFDGRLRCEGGGGYPGGPGNGGPGGGPGGPGPGPGPGGPGGGPGGGWNGGQGNGPVGLILFENPDYRGQRLELRESVNDLYGSGMDEETTSIRVISGRWELCSAAGFGGDCKIVDKDTPNLKVYNLNDRVSSVRRIRR